MKNMENEKSNIDRDVYGELYSQHYFEQYKLYLEGIERISDRRENANKYFITVNSGIIVAISFSLQYLENTCYFIPALAALLLLGTMISIIFYFLINSYKQLNSGKFKVLHKIEERLPITLYSEEWEALGRGKDHKKYYPFSHIERLIPIVFGVLYLLAYIYFMKIMFL